MDKWELIEITVDQLIEQWNNNKESFEVDVSDLTICWSPATLNDDSEDKSLSTDSMKLRKGVIIAYSRKNTFECFIYKIDDASKRPASDAVAENSVSAKKCLAPFRSLYRKFMRLRRDILIHETQKANSSYLSNLVGVFPGTLDDHLLGSKDGKKEKE